MGFLYAITTLGLVSFLCPVVYLLFKYAMKEKSYDERIAEQKKKLATEHNLKARSRHQASKKPVKKVEKEKLVPEKKNKVQSTNSSGKDVKKNESPKNILSSSIDKLDSTTVSKKKSDRGHSKGSNSSQGLKLTSDYVDEQNYSSVDNDNQDNNVMVSEDDKSSVSEFVITNSSGVETSNTGSIHSEISSLSSTVHNSGNDSESSSVNEKIVMKKTVDQNGSQPENVEKPKSSTDQQPVKKHSIKLDNSALNPKVDDKNKDLKSPKQKLDDKVKSEDEKSKEMLSASSDKNMKSSESDNNEVSSDVASSVDVNKETDSLTVHESVSDKDVNMEKSPSVSKKCNGSSGAGKSSPIQGAKGQRQAANGKNTKKQTTEMKTLQKISNESNGPMNVTLLVPLLAKAELSRSEIQNLIDLLLNKQQENGTIDAEWIGGGRQDPIVKLKKQLAEKEKSLAAEQEAHQAIQNKVKELRAELNIEKHANRQREETLISRQADMQTLNVRIQEISDEKQNLAKQLQQLQAKLNEERFISTSLKEENTKTKKNLQQELLVQRQQLELHIAHLNEQHSQAIISLDAQVNQLHIRLQDQETANAQINEDNVMLRDRIAMHDNQLAHYQQTHSANQDLIMQIEDLKNFKTILERELQNSHSENTRLSNEIKTVTEQLNRKSKDIETINHLVQNMKVENEELIKESSRHSEQLTFTCNEKNQLQMENEKLRKHLMELNDNSRNSDELEELKNGITAYRNSLAEKNFEIDHLKEHISQLEAYSQNYQSRNLDLQEQEKRMNELKVQLEKQQAKNNDLRSKNWKAMEALSNMEKTLETKLKGVATSLNEIRTKERGAVLQKLISLSNTVTLPCPPASSEDDVWFEYLEKVFKEVNKNCCINQPNPFSSSYDEYSVSKENVPVLDELEKQNCQLQTMVSHYKCIISDTEGMLNSLQKHVEQEENRWSEQVRILSDQVQSMNEKIQSQQTQFASIVEERNRLLDNVKNIQNGCIQNDVYNNEQKLSNCVTKCGAPLLTNSSVNENTISS